MARPITAVDARRLPAFIQQPGWTYVINPGSFNTYHEAQVIPVLGWYLDGATYVPLAPGFILTSDEVVFATAAEAERIGDGVALAMTQASLRNLRKASGA